MSALTPDTQLRLYSRIRSLEARSLAVQAALGRLKTRCVHGGPGTTIDMVAQVAELRDQLRCADELAAQLEGMLGVRRMTAGDATTQRKGCPVPPPEPTPCLSGTTEAISVPDLFLTLSGLGKTGTLGLRAGARMFSFEFEQGRIVHAVANELDANERIGTILARLDKLDARQIGAHVEQAAEALQPLGAWLVDRGVIDATDLREALDEQVQLIFRAAFELKGATFRFVDGSLTELEQRTVRNTTELLLEAARLKDEATALDPAVR